MERSLFVLRFAISCAFLLSAPLAALTNHKGGYNLTSISKSALAVTRTLTGEIPDRIPSLKATEAGIETVQMVAQWQSRFWPCLYPKDAHQG